MPISAPMPQLALCRDSYRRFSPYPYMSILPYTIGFAKVGLSLPRSRLFLMALSDSNGDPTSPNDHTVGVVSPSRGVVFILIRRRSSPGKHSDEMEHRETKAVWPGWALGDRSTLPRDRSRVVLRRTYGTLG